MAADINQTVDALWRIESPKLIAGLARMVRDVGLAEELAQDALVTALERWPATGIPDRPGAWLMATAKNRAIDRLRHRKLAERKHAEIGRELGLSELEMQAVQAASLLHVPLFAAAAAQYSAGSVDGPRLIALDEAFVGIDDQMRARLMGLLTQLDLDVLLTSHEFWGFYETVPALVLYDLTRRPPLLGVHAQRFDWTAGVDDDPDAEP